MGAYEHRLKETRSFSSFGYSIVVVIIVLLSYYSCVISRLRETFETNGQLLFLIVFHVLLFLQQWSYWACVIEKPGIAPKEFKLTQKEIREMDRSQVEELVSSKVGKKIRFQTFGRAINLRLCQYTDYIKPDRAMYDRSTGTIVLRYDHYCPWVSNTIGWHNHKYFVLFLIYTTLLVSVALLWIGLRIQLESRIRLVG